MSQAKKNKNNEINSEHFSCNSDYKVSFSDLFDISDLKIHKNVRTEKGIYMNDNQKEIINMSSKLPNGKGVIIDSIKNEKTNLKNKLNLEEFNTNDVFIEQNISAFEDDNKLSKEILCLNQQSTMEIEEIMESDGNNSKLQDPLAMIADKDMVEKKS